MRNRSCAMALPLVATSCALIIDGRGLAKVARGHEMQSDSFDEGLWSILPDELLDLIYEQLSFAAKCRFRCVSRRWREIRFSSPLPVCTIMSKAGDQNAMFHSDAERKWMSLPCNTHVPSGRSWEFVDSDGGLVCFQCNIDGWFWLWVCNPLKPSLSRLIRPKYERRDPRTCIPQAPKMKLLVDEASGTYKIVASLDQLPCTAVYDSASSRWRCHDGCNTRMLSLEFFVWGSKLYAYSTEKNLQEDDRWLAVLNMGKPRWKRIPVKLPREVQFRTNRFFMSNKKEVILVLSSNRKLYRPYFSVWKLLDRDAHFAPGSFCKLKNWEKVEIGSERAVVDLRGHRLTSASFDGEHICFAFRDDSITLDGSRGYKCMRYSLAAKSWSEMPCRKDWGEGFGLCTWEPNWDIDPS